MYMWVVLLRAMHDNMQSAPSVLLSNLVTFCVSGSLETLLLGRHLDCNQALLSMYAFVCGRKQIIFMTNFKV